MQLQKYLFRGRYFTEEEIELIREIIMEHKFEGRTKIAIIVCEKLGWRQINGRLKKVSCLEALRRMQERGLIQLPENNSLGGYRKMKLLQKDEVDFNEPQREIEGIIKSTARLRFELVKGKKEEKLWRYLIQCYHYLGYKRLVGRKLKYFIYLDDELIALIGFSDGIYHHHLRDRWLGWNRETLEKRRHLIINNVRFLILPWVKIKNLGSRILSQAALVVPEDWERLHGYRPLLMETFVDRQRFKGTVYKAANWLFIGRTEGKGRSGRRYFFHGCIRDYYIYPLDKDAFIKLKFDGI